VIEVQLDPEQLYMRQSSQHVKQTPIMDFKKLSKVPSRKKAETKPKHLTELEKSIDQAVKTSEIASNVNLLARKSRSASKRNRKSKSPSQGKSLSLRRPVNTRITQAIMEESDPFESPK